MSDLIEQIASRTNIPPDLVRRGVGGLLSVVKDHDGGKAFEAIKAKVPDAHGLVSEFEQTREPAKGGMFAVITDLASKVLGGQAGEGAALVTILAQTGLSPEQIKTLLPQVFSVLRMVLPAETVDKIVHAIPGLAALLEPPADPEPTQGAGDPKAPPAPAGSH